MVEQVKQKLITAFEMVDIVPIIFYFDLKVDWDRKVKIF